MTDGAARFANWRDFAVTDVAEEIRELENRRYQAMTDADIATLDELLSADLVYGHSDASRDSKQSYLSLIHI